MRSGAALSGKLRSMRGGRWRPSNRPEPISRPHCRKTHHPRRRPRRAFLCRSYLPVRNLPTPRRPSIWPIFRLLSGGDICLLASSMPARPTDGASQRLPHRPKTGPAWRLVKTAVPSLTDKAAQEVINSWLHCKVLEIRSYRDPIDRRNYPGLFVIPLEGFAEVSYTLPHLFCTYIPQASRCRFYPPSLRLCLTPLPWHLPWPPRLLPKSAKSLPFGQQAWVRKSIPLGAQTKALLTECKNGSKS